MRINFRTQPLAKEALGVAHHRHPLTIDEFAQFFCSDVLRGFIKTDDGHGWYWPLRRCCLEGAKPLLPSEVSDNPFFCTPQDTVLTFSRSSPSPEYASLVGQYQALHRDGDRARGVAPEELYPGNSLPAHAERIATLIQKTGATSLLDYGCGKGLQYQWTDISLKSGNVVASLKSYWKTESIHLYDPAISAYSALPAGKFDGVISTDVLEHCPPQDVDWILEEVFAYARCFVFLNIACHKAKARLPDGQNAHRTAMSPRWWAPKIESAARQHPDVKYVAVLEQKRGFWKLKHRFRTVVSNIPA